VSESIKVGDVVTLRDPDRPWRVVYVDVDRGFARLECAAEAWVKSRVVDLDELHPYREYPDEELLV
jgi:hypothetical protein